MNEKSDSILNWSTVAKVCTGVNVALGLCVWATYALEKKDRAIKEQQRNEFRWTDKNRWE